jgi:hypothetical protein
MAKFRDVPSVSYVLTTMAREWSREADPEKGEEARSGVQYEVWLQDGADQSPRGLRVRGPELFAACEALQGQYANVVERIQATNRATWNRGERLELPELDCTLQTITPYEDPSAKANGRARATAASE